MRMNGRDVSGTRARSRAGPNLREKTAGAGGHCEPRASWWRSMLRSAAASAGLLAAGVGADASPVAVENGNYRSAAAAPETWQAFARQLQGRVEQRLAGDDAKARRFQDYLTKRNQQSDAAPLTLVLRTWVLADGKVDRIEFDGIDDSVAIDDLRAANRRQCRRAAAADAAALAHPSFASGEGSVAAGGIAHDAAPSAGAAVGRKVFVAWPGSARAETSPTLASFDARCRV
jgi:hypothetical protein